MNLEQACRPRRGSCRLIPERGCFGDLPGDEIVVSPPFPIVEPLVSFMGWVDTPTLFSGLNAWIVVFDIEHEEYLEAVDLTSYVGTIPTGLASGILA